jgi:hypothetical protein
VGLQLQELSEAEAAKLKPTYQDGKLVAFESRADENFS